jgi:hypothetical protein
MANAPKAGGSPVGAIVAGIASGVILGIASIVVLVLVGGDAPQFKGTNVVLPLLGFGIPIAFVVVAIVCIRKPFVAALLFTAAIVYAVPVAGCAVIAKGVAFAPAVPTAREAFDA